jgi:hypothetical protein
MSRTANFSAALIALASISATSRAHAYCPSYTPAETAGGQNCGVAPSNGTNPSPAAWKAIFALVAPGKASWGTNGPDIGTMGAGCGKPVVQHNVEAHFPCHVMKAIAMQESGWRQFCVPDTPAASVGAPERTIVAFDCGYGIGQVTSGMHVGEAPAFDRTRVAGDPEYNLATGTLILREKWIATNCVGDNNPDLVEDWYVAIWAYNGLAYSNNPNNPNLAAGRGVYNPSNGGSYTYQERVLGWMEHPPSAAHWSVLAPAYPNRGDIGQATTPPNLPEPSCAGPTNCTATRGTHTSSCDVVAPPDAGGGDAGGSGDAGTESDAGSVADDGGFPGRDGSTADGGANGAGGGCSCDVVGSGEHSPRTPLGAALTAAFALVAFAGRRRRAPSTLGSKPVKSRVTAAPRSAPR